MQNIYFFNPTGEMAMANGTISYMPPKNLQLFERDLSFLPSFYAREKDIIVTENIPDKRFLDQWTALGMQEFEYRRSVDLKTPLSYQRLCPWSWNQAIHHKIKHLKPYAAENFKSSPNFTWHQDHKLFFSRATTNQIQEYILHDAKKNSLVSLKYAAITIDNMNDLDQWLSNHPKAIIKMPWSSSGRGIHIIDRTIGQTIDYPWLNGAFKQQGFITAEPLLDKKFDFSFQLYLHANGDIDLKGISYSLNDHKGHFIGGNINWPDKENEISQFLSDEVLHSAALSLIKALKKIKPQQLYEGPLGVDAIVYSDENKKLKIHPCVDINWRYNMGLINIHLNQFLATNSIGQWKIGPFKTGEWNNFIHANMHNKPLIIKDAKIVSGLLNMTPPNKNARFGVWMEVTPREK